MRIDHADDGQEQQSIANLQDGRRQLADGFLLLPDDALAFANDGVHDQADVEEGDLLERHETLERFARLARGVLQDRDADRLQEVMKSRDEDTKLEADSAVERGELHALLGVRGAVIAAHHRRQMHALELARAFGQRAIAREHPALFELAQVIEEHRRELFDMTEHDVADRRDPLKILRFEPDDAPAPFDRLHRQRHLAHQELRRCLAAHVRHSYGSLVQKAFRKAPGRRSSAYCGSVTGHKDVRRPLRPLHSAARDASQSETFVHRSRSSRATLHSPRTRLLENSLRWRELLEGAP